MAVTEDGDQAQAQASRCDAALPTLHLCYDSAAASSNDANTVVGTIKRFVPTKSSDNGAKHAVTRKDTRS